MTSESETPITKTQAVDVSTENYKLAGTFAIFSFYTVFAFFLDGNPRSNWANHLGNGLACGILSLVSAAIILAVVKGFPKDRTTRRVFLSNLAFPMILTGFLWIRCANDFFTKQAEQRRYAELAEEKMGEQARRKQEAEPVIRMAKSVLDDSIRKSLREEEGSIKIVGWSVSSLGEGTWLVKFQYSVNGVNKWFLYEYNDYIRDFKSVLADESLKNHYLNTDSEGTSFNEATRSQMGDWYGPVR